MDLMVKKLNSIHGFIAFNSLFLIPNFGLGENVTIYGIDNSSSTHADYKQKKIIGKEPTQGLDNTK